ncbi:unnamed protein product [Diamesa hyperborea]
MSEENSSTKTPLSVIKFLELCLSIVCCYLHFYSFDDGDLVTGFIATGTFCGYVIILIAIMAGYMMKASINKRINLFYSLMGSGLFMVSGVFIIQAWEHAFRTRTRDLAITKGAVSLINGIIFLMDTIFTFREKK